MRRAFLTLAMCTLWLPTLASVREDSLDESIQQDCPNGVFRHVLLDNGEALVPDLDSIALMIEATAYAA